MYIVLLGISPISSLPKRSYFLLSVISNVNSSIEVVLPVSQEAIFKPALGSTVVMSLTGQMSCSKIVWSGQ